jgi:NADH-quinone oxidoreductase subunit M
VFFGPHKREDRGPVDIALVSIVVVAFLSVLLFLPPFSSALADNIYKSIVVAGLWK